jgi:signal transduction histidine kinase
MGKKHLPIFLGMIVSLAALGSFFSWVSPGWMERMNRGTTVFEGLFFLSIFFWSLAILPHWKSAKTLCLGSLLLAVGSFADVYDNFFIEPRWEDVFIENLSLTLGAGLFGLGIWFWVKEKEQLLDQLQKERDFEASLIPKLSHDLRVPLTNLVGITSILQDDPKFSEDSARREYLEVMWRGAKEMNLLIDNILETHRLKSGKVELSPSTISLVSLLDEICKDFQYQVKKKELTIVKDCVDQELTLEADRVKVMRIIQNLLANATRFSPRGGKIALKTSCGNGEVTIRVIDEGSGISTDQIAMIMQGSPSSAKKAAEGGNESYGIGLKVVREFVQLHGGRFWIEPNFPKGAQFCFTLPQRPLDPNPKSKTCTEPFDSAQDKLRRSIQNPKS